MSAGNFRNIDVPPSLQKLNVSAMGRDNQRFLIEYRYSSRDGIPITVDILFDIKQSRWDTLEEFRKAASKRPHIRPEQIQRIIAALRADEYCIKIFSYYEFDSKIADDNNNNPDTGSTSVIEIGEPDGNGGDDNTAEEQEEAYASSVSDPDYTDEGLPLLSVSSAIRKDPMRLCVTGVIDTVGKPFKLLREINFRCSNIKCPRFDSPERCILDTPIYTTQDMPIAFNGGMGEYYEKVRCPACRHPRTATPNYSRFENAKVIQLKNLSRSRNGKNKVPSAVSANTTLSMEHLTVLVTGKHTLSVGLGEEVEMVGESYVLASDIAASRFGGSGGNLSHAGDSGKSQPILYAKRINIQNVKESSI